MYDYDSSVRDWREATAAMPWGVQRVFKTALESVADGSIIMAWGSDVVDGHPCLVNSVSAMINSSTKADNSTQPSVFAPAVVGAFDRLNSVLHDRFKNAEYHIVSPLAADVLLQHFGAMQPEPVVEPVKTEVDVINQPYIELSDEALMAAWVDTNTMPAPVDVTDQPSERERDIMDLAESIGVMKHVEDYFKSGNSNSDGTQI